LSFSSRRRKILLSTRVVPRLHVDTPFSSTPLVAGRRTALDCKPKLSSLSLSVVLVPLVPFTTHLWLLVRTLLLLVTQLLLLLPELLGSILLLLAP
jgi:hypothetical protein